jgi:hypothetical protein
MKLLIILLLSLALVGCPDPVIITKFKVVEAVTPTAPAPLSLVAPYFYVVSPANMAEFIECINKENHGVFFALTPGDYENLAANTQEFKRYIGQCRQVNSYYEGLLSADRTVSGEE